VEHHDSDEEQEKDGEAENRKREIDQEEKEQLISRHVLFADSDSGVS